jgi:hypothetical protein
MAPAGVGATGFRTIQAIYRRQSRAVSPPISRADGYLPDPLGEQVQRQVRVQSGLRQRVAPRRLRKAAHQV